MSRPEQSSMPGPRHGDETEQWAYDRFGLESYGRPWCDARTSDGIHIEIKGCQRWQSNGSGRLRGRFRLWKSAHSTLVEHGGAYLFAVYEVSRRGNLSTYAWRLLPAVAVTPIVDDYWQDYSHRESKGSTALLSWPNVLPRYKE